MFFCGFSTPSLWIASYFSAWLSAWVIFNQFGGWAATVTGIFLTILYTALAAIVRSIRKARIIPSPVESDASRSKDRFKRHLL